MPLLSHRSGRPAFWLLALALAVASVAAPAAAASRNSAKCPAGTNLVNGKCIQKCPSPMIPTAAGACACPENFYFGAGKCVPSGCPIGSTSVKGKCVVTPKTSPPAPR